MRLATILLLAACTAPPAPPSLPWVSGFTTTASGDTESLPAAQRLAAVTGTRDEAGYGAIAVSTGSGAILASYHDGVAVLDSNDRLVARAPGFDVEGSADDLVALATGDAKLDAPVIVLAVTRGGHRVSTTSIVVYQVGADEQLDQLFAGAIEERDGDQTRSGSLAFFPHGLMYRPPGGGFQRWTFDPTARKYVHKRQVNRRVEPDRLVPGS
ncbi:MAG TPA: hypothetical protein VLX92_07140 [Kofleriaceae bacterium]|nr:hypothetical protein [Kofleriaceae bacterium]